MKTRRPGKPPRNAFGLPLILFFLTIIVTLTLVAAGQIASFHQEVAHGVSSTRASYAAEAGVARVLLELSKNPDYAPGTLVLPDGDPDGLDFSDPSLGAEVEVINNFSGGGPVSTPEGTLEPGRVWLRSKGKLSGVEYRSQRYTATAIVTRPDVIMSYGLRQLVGQIKLGANSSVRSYVPAGSVDPKPPAVFGSNVTIRTNEEGLFSPGSTLINGVVELPTSTTPISASPSGGTTIVQEAPPLLKFSEPLAYRGLPHPDRTGASLDLPPGEPYGEIVVISGGTLTLHSGEYYARNLDLRDGARVVVDASTAAPCVFYIGSGFGLAGNNEVNWNGAPRMLQFYDCDLEGDGINSNWTGNNIRMSCVWASRETGVNFGDNIQYYGALDAQLVSYGDNSQLVFDESLLGQVLEGKPEWVITKKER